MTTISTNPVSRSGRGGNRRGRLRLGVIAGFLVALLAWGAAPAVAAPAAKPSGRITFGVEPASARAADGRPYFSFGVSAGAVLYDHAAVVNYSSRTLSLQLYATDAIETSAGGYGLLPSSVRPTGVGAWVSFPPRFANLQVPPASPTGPGEVVVPLTVRIPDNATPGDHAGGIVASLRTVGTSKGQKVILVVRTGTRLFIRVAGALAPRLSISDLHATYAGTLNPIGKGEVTVSYAVNNTGNVDLALTQRVAVSGLVSDHRQIALANLPLLLPGASTDERVVVAGVWPQFRLRATVSAIEQVPVGSAGVPSLATVSASVSVWAIPWPLLAVIVLMLIAVVVSFRLRRRRATPPVAPERELVKV
jgi:hypothetical protein